MPVAAAAVPQALLSSLGALNQSVGVAKAEFDSLAGSVTKYVQAFAPSAVILFNQTMRDLYAVVGQALLPVMNMLTESVRAVGSVVFPAMLALEPILRQLMDAFMGLWSSGLSSLTVLLDGLVTVADMFAQLYQALQPLMQLFSSLYGVILSLFILPLKLVGVALGAVMWALNPLIALFNLLTIPLQMMQVYLSGLGAVLQEVMKSVFGAVNPLAGTIGDLKTIFGQLAKIVLIAIGAFAKWIATFLPAANAMLAGMITALGGKRQDIQGQAAATNAGFKDIQSFGRDLAASMSMAMGGGPAASKEEAWRTETLEELKRIQAGAGTTTETIKASIKEVGEVLAKAFTDALKGQAYSGTRSTALNVAAMANPITGTYMGVRAAWRLIFGR